MTSIAAALMFLGYVAAALLLPGRAAAGRKRGVTLFLAYALAASFGAGLTQRDLWPFVAWPLVAGTLEPEVTHPRIVAVDRVGREHDVDFRAWRPLSVLELLSYVNHRFPALDAARKDTVAAWLLSAAEAARRHASAGGALPRGALPGTLAAPHFILSPRPWSVRDRVPAEPLVEIRMYRETWNLEAWARGERTVHRELLHQFPRGR